MRATPLEPALYWMMRLACAAEFVGHGAYGALLGKESWFGYFGVLGIPSASVASSGLLTVVGTAEMVMGLVAFVLPVPALLLVLMAWKVFTELLRPAAGEPFWEFVERASNNMVAPAALLYVRGWPRSLTSWFTAAAPTSRR